MNFKKFATIVFILILITVFISFLFFPIKKNKIYRPKKEAINSFEIEGTLAFFNKKNKNLISKINVEIANNDFEKARGLMHRRFMPENVGMVFISDEAKQQSFWMKNTHIALDLIFVDANSKIVQISANAIPYSEKSIPCEKKAKYVIEVNEYFCVNNNISVGDSIFLKKINLK